MDNTKLFQKARDYAFLLLTSRLRSEYELRERLKRKKFPEDVIQETITFLKEKRFIDDVEFTKALVNSRITRQIGLRRIRQELRLKGVDKKIIESALDSLDPEYSEQDTVEELARLRLSKLKGIEPTKARRRVYEYLLRRGFSLDTVMEKLNKIKPNRS